MASDDAVAPVGPRLDVDVVRDSLPANGASRLSEVVIELSGLTARRAWAALAALAAAGDAKVYTWAGQSWAKRVSPALGGQP